MSEEDKVAPEQTMVNGAIDNTLVVTLRKAVIANGEEVKELKFREPTAADIERCGSPVHIELFTGSDQPKMTYETKSMFAMMCALAAVPPSTIKQLNAKDWEFAALMIAHRFFLPD